MNKILRAELDKYEEKVDAARADRVERAMASIRLEIHNLLDALGEQEQRAREGRLAILNQYSDAYGIFDFGDDVEVEIVRDGDC